MSSSSNAGSASVQGCGNGVLLRVATEADAEGVLALLWAAFPAEQLQYSIYRDAGVLPYLRGQMREDKFVVAEHAGSIAGYYQARRQGAVLLCKFIATAPEWRGAGIGSALLNHFEQHARQQGCRALELDRLAAEEHVGQWYARRGFQPIASSTIFRLRLPAVAPDSPLAVERTVLDRALREERACGFAVLPALWHSDKLPVGLIASRDCKIFLDAGDRLGELAAAITATFPDRSFLLGACATVPASLVSATISEISIRMRKEIR